MLDQPDRDDLNDLAWTFVTARPNHPVRKTSDPFELPARLLQRITAREPERAQALADARLWLSVPVLYGIGLTVAIREPLDVARFAGWERSIANVAVDVTWCHDMSCQETEGLQIHLHRLAFEDGGWRVVQLLDERSRAELAAQIALFRQWRGTSV